MKVNLKLNLNLALPVQIFPLKEGKYQRETLVSLWIQKEVENVSAEGKEA